MVRGTKTNPQPLEASIYFCRVIRDYNYHYSKALLVPVYTLNLNQKTKAYFKKADLPFKVVFVCTSVPLPAGLIFQISP